jgi:hypothetical protein
MATTSSRTSSRGRSTSVCGPLSAASNACLGTTEWPSGIPVPQASIEFEVLDVADAAAELTAKGYRLIHEARTEPWGQITARLESPEGLLIAVCKFPGVPRRIGELKSAVPLFP